jgi:hypothetical protein
MEENNFEEDGLPSLDELPPLISIDEDDDDDEDGVLPMSYYIERERAILNRINEEQHRSQGASQDDYIFIDVRNLPEERVHDSLCDDQFSRPFNDARNRATSQLEDYTSIRSEYDEQFARISARILFEEEKEEKEEIRRQGLPYELLQGLHEDTEEVVSDCGSVNGSDDPPLDLIRCWSDGDDDPFF